ncbi:MAG: response regulator [Elusimicrobia bacterium]|nr:response regulator [Elusimicrobiota bacterium]
MGRHPAGILVADGDPAFRRAIAEVLSQAGVHCATVSDGREALAAGADERWDAVALSVKLDSINGFDVFGALRSLEPSLPVVFLTESSQADIFESAAAGIGAFAALRKPVEPEVLARALLLARTFGRAMS